MKEKLYTIPVNEAFDQDSECPLCVLHQKLEEDILHYVLGASYMEEDVRGETDRMGFCEKHYRQIYGAQNRLGVALMVSTHLKKLNAVMENLLAEEEKGSVKKGLFKKAEGESPLVAQLEEVSHSCYACHRMRGRMESYIDTFFHLWRTEQELRNKVLKGKGFCLEHLKTLFQEGRKRMNMADFQAFVSAVAPIELENLKRVEEELDWFIQKFDYRFQNEPWKNSKDSLSRAILKISSVQVED